MKPIERLVRALEVKSLDLHESGLLFTLKHNSWLIVGMFWLRSPSTLKVILQVHFPYNMVLTDLSKLASRFHSDKTQVI